MNELLAAFSFAFGFAGLFIIFVLWLCRRYKLPGFERRQFGHRNREFEKSSGTRG